MKSTRTRCLAAFLIAGAPAFAAEKAMTSEQLRDLLSSGKTLILGGPGSGYSGQLMIYADGTASGGALTDAGVKIEFSGVWKVVHNQFCRTWQGGSDSGKNVCETWIMTAPNSVKVMAKGRTIGVNSW